MSGAGRAHRVVAGIGRHFRKPRLLAFRDAFNPTADTRILDVGGDEGTWHLYHELTGVLPRVTVLNLSPSYKPADPRVSWLYGDARTLPFGPGDFDLVYSNSVIEHVGTLEQQRRMADEIRRLAAPYWVQTPNRRFFLEPHLVAPLAQFAPRGVARRLGRYFSGIAAARLAVGGGLVSWAELDLILDEVRLLTRAELRELFPDAAIVTERVLGFAKSFVMVRQ
jgi:hypothetical protein